MQMRSMNDAPEGRVVLALFRKDAFAEGSRFSGWNGLWVSVNHGGRTVSGFDVGWSIAGPAGQSGFHAEQFVGFVEPEAMPAEVVG